MAWDQIRVALENLKTIAAASKQKAEVKHVLERLPLVLSALESTVPSSDDLMEICTLLRKPVLPLYMNLLLPTMKLTSALLDGIHKHKVAPARAQKDFAALQPWERVQRAITAGVLDYLDTSSTPDASKGVVENCLFSVLCQHYFPSASELICEETALDLRCNVYILLSTSVGNHAANQSKLRDYLLGGARLGLAISRTKEFLALETLFELFIAICPPKAVTDKYRRFVDQVFDPSLFPSHKALKNIAASLKTTEWEEASAAFIKVLAGMNIDFPQPIPIYSAKTSDGSPSPCVTMYVDRDGLTSNIDRDDAYDTFFVPYSNISKIHYSSYSTLSTTFYFDLAIPPTVGGVIPDTPRTVTLNIDVSRGNREQFLAALKARGLAHRFDQGDLKLSKADDDLPLEFPPSQALPQTFPEKASRVYNIDPASDAIEKSPDRLKKSTLAGKPSKKGRALAQTDNKIDGPSPKKLKSSTPVINTEGQPSARTGILDVPLPAIDISANDEAELNLGSDKENKRFAKHKGTPELVSKKRDPKRKPLEVVELVDRPTKRVRVDPEQDLPEISSPLKGKSPRKTRQYGKRGRASSPPQAPDFNDDLDSIPAVKSAARQGGVKKATVAGAMKGKTDKKDEVKKAAAAAKGKAPEKVKATVPAKTKAKPEPAVDDDTKPTRRSARVACKQAEVKPGPLSYDVEESQSGGEEESEYKPTNEKPLPDTYKKENATETKKPRPRPKIVEKKIQAPAESKVPQTKAVAKKTQPPVESKVPKPRAIADKGISPPPELKVQPKAVIVDTPPTPEPRLPQPKAVADKNNQQPPREIKPTKSKKDKEAPWEKIDFLKHKQDDNAQSDQVSANEEPTSGLDLPAQPVSIEEDFGFSLDYVDVEVPLKLGDDESLGLDVDSSSDLDKTAIDHATKDLSPKHESTASTPLTFLPDVVEITDNPSARDLIKESDPVQSSSAVRADSQKNALAELPERVPSVNPDTRNSPPPINSTRSKLNSHSLSAPAVPFQPQAKLFFKPNPKQRLNQLSVAEHKSLTLSNDPVPSLRAIPKHDTTPKHRQVSPAVALLRRTALENPEDSARVSTPLRPPLKGLPLEPPTIIKKQRHQQHVTFSPLPQSSPRFAPSATARRELEQQQRDQVRKFRDADDSNTDSVVAQHPARHRNEFRVPNKTAEVRGIVEILQDIQEVIVAKVSNRFEGVKKEVRIGRDSILRAAAADVDAMRAKSAEHFNNMVDLEAEYAACHRRIIEPLEDLCAIDKELVTRLGEIIQHHDRHGLSKKFPKSLPSLPRCFLSPSVE